MINTVKLVMVTEEEKKSICINQDWVEWATGMLGKHWNISISLVGLVFGLQYLSGTSTFLLFSSDSATSRKNAPRYLCGYVSSCGTGFPSRPNYSLVRCTVNFRGIQTINSRIFTSPDTFLGPLSVSNGTVYARCGLRHFVILLVCLIFVSARA